MNKALGLLVIGLLVYTTALAAPDSDRVALEAAMHRWTTAVNSQDARTLTTAMTEDVELLDASAASVKGRDAAIQTLREVATRGRLVVTTQEISIANDVAWRVLALAQTQKNGDVHARGRALEIWKRVKGTWRLHRMMSAGVIIPPAVSLSRPPLNEPVLDRPKD
jgi:ketosteroid isomerase-like protein